MVRSLFAPAAILAALGLPFMTGCPTVEPCVETTLTALQADVFNGSCATSSCHGGGAPSRNLDMNDGATHGSTVGVAGVEPGTTRIVAGNPDESLFYQVLLEGVGNTRRMPPGFELDECEVEAVRVWIADGAQDN